MLNFKKHSRIIIALAVVFAVVLSVGFAANRLAASDISITPDEPPQDLITTLPEPQLSSTPRQDGLPPSLPEPQPGEPAPPPAALSPVPAPGVRVVIEEWDGISASALELVYEDDYYQYYLTSIRSDRIMLTFDDGQRISLKDAISQDKISIEDLILNGLELYIQSKAENNRPAR